ncbi:hypothetical protein Patl1_14968 [Pistacia atlantica]|uniref:Uncharacterized protein n=1 Tax=Pistacia atlantica TaxID=434234 RepID=A0ACC1B6W2_9ROSI|nr:hypothetical protein Patl1_14968 [Pistacia atlantica]
MASLLSLNSLTLNASSPFKGNICNLRPNPSHFFNFSLKVQRQQNRTSLTILNQAAATPAPPASVSGPVTNVRFRLDNLGPQPGSRKKGKRKGRGISAGQGGSCGFGMRGQKSRSGPGVRKGFEGGQMPLYRRIPKLRGIAGEFLLTSFSSCFYKEGDEVSLESLKKKGLINPSGRERRLPLKILGDGELSVKLNFKARAFSTAAKEKLEAAGCSLTVLPGRKKWVKPSVAKNLARAEEYFAKKKAAAAASEPASA